jgi:hypothetical protein
MQSEHRGRYRDDVIMALADAFYEAAIDQRTEV